MASLSAYASRFLSLGANDNSDSQHNDDTDPLFRSHLEDSSLSSSDGLPSASTAQHQSQSNRNSGSNSLAGMSRYSFYGAYGGGNGGYSIYANQNSKRHDKRHGKHIGSSKMMMNQSIREIDDEDDVDLWRNQRRRVGLDDRHESCDEDEGLSMSDRDDDDEGGASHKQSERPKKESVASTVDGNENGSETLDPFLAEDDIQRGESSRSRSKSHAKSTRVKSKPALEASSAKSRLGDQLRSDLDLRKPGNKTSNATKKGWLAHGDESSIISEAEAEAEAEGCLNTTLDRENGDVLFDSTHELKGEKKGKAKHRSLLPSDDGSGGSDASGSQTSRDESQHMDKSRIDKKGKRKASDPARDGGDADGDLTVSINLSPNQSRLSASRRKDEGRKSRSRFRGGEASSRRTNSDSLTSEDESTAFDSDFSQDAGPTPANKSMIQLDTFRLPPVPSNDSWAPWPWHLLKLPDSLRDAWDDRIWERNRQRGDYDAWGEYENEDTSNRSRRQRERGARSQAEEEQDSSRSPSWREWNDRKAVVGFCLAFVSVFVVGGAGSFAAKQSASEPPPTPGASVPSPSSTYSSILHSVPLLFLLTFLSLTAGFSQFLLLRLLRTLPARIGAKVLSVALVALPIVLGLGWAWAFGSSFWDDEEERSGGGWSTFGLRLISLVPLVLAIIFSRMLYSQRNSLSRSLSVLELSSRIVSFHPSLVFLAFSLLGSFLLLSIPILTIFSRLFMHGHFARLRPVSKGGVDEWVWKTDLSAKWLAYMTFLVWIWSWSIGRGIMRVTVSGVVAHWYYAQVQGHDSAGEAFSSQREQDVGVEDARGGGDPSLAESTFPEEVGIAAHGARDLYSSESVLMGEDSMTPSAPGPSAPGAWDPPSTSRANQIHQAKSYLEPGHDSPISSLDLVRANFLKATGTSLGTIIQSSFLLTISYILLIISSVARKFARILITPGTPAFLSPLLHLATLLAGIGSIVKGVSEYGLIYTGITGQSWRKSTKIAKRVTLRFGSKGALDGLVIHSLLSLSSLSLSFLTALAGFLYATHNLHSPSDAPLIGLLCGIIPYWTLRISSDVIGNAYLALFLRISSVILLHYPVSIFSSLTSSADTLYLCHALDLAADSPDALNEASIAETNEHIRPYKNREQVRSAFLNPASALPF